jgi:hypothetical protein
MKTDTRPHEELCQLLAAMEEGSISAGEIARIDELVRSDQRLLRQYIEYTRMVSDLRFGLAGERPQDMLSRLIDGVSDVSADIPPSSLPLRPSLFSLLSSPAGIAFSYLVAAILVSAAVLSAWHWRVLPGREAAMPAPQAVAAAVPVNPEAAAMPVGKITGMADCRWVESGSAVRVGSPVPLGRKFMLATGLIEIAYNTGTTVVLQGPAAYQVDSRQSGFLLCGRLVARTERGSGFRAQGSDSAVARGAETPPSPFPLPPSSAHPRSRIAHPAFAVRTPSSIISSGDAELGVQVEKSGDSKAHVFRGYVELRFAGGDGAGVQLLPMTENESARVEQLSGMRVAGLIPSRTLPTQFARRMTDQPAAPPPPETTWKEYALGPNWPVATGAEAANFELRPAAVTPVTLCSAPAEENWVAMRVVGRRTFRFRFDLSLKGMLPDTAVLWGRFFAHNYVSAIRLNGHSVPVPKHGDERPVQQFGEFSIREGLRDGANAMEFDVDDLFPADSDQVDPHKKSPLALGMALGGFAILSRVEIPADDAAPPGGRQEK